MEHLTKDALLGANDLVEREVELPAIGGKVRVRALPAAYSRQAHSEAAEVTNVTNPKTGRDEQVVKVNVARMEALQVLHGLVEPKLDTLEEAEAFGKQCGPSFVKVIEVIDEISGVDKQAIEDAEARFPDREEGSPGSNGASDATGDGRSDLPGRVGATAEDAGGGAG